MKKCTQCGEEKDETEFYKEKRQKSGLRCNCKTCHNKKRDAWKKNHPERVKQHLRNYYSAHKSYWKEREKNLSQEEKEKKRIYLKEYYNTHKERLLNQNREKHHAKPKEDRQRYAQRYYELHKEEICLRSRENYKKLSEEDKAKNVERVRLWRKKNRQKAKAWSAVGNALIRGELQKPNQCEKCMKEDTRIHAHHDDYEKPLEVKWLCHECHMNLHKKKRKINH